ALDVAFQCSPDHPWVEAHPEWFRHRPDGSIQYAENPPKKYEDIYPFDFETDEWESLWEALKGVFDFWIGQGVKIFRVDNPHTKPFPFWEWAIREIRAEHPETIFLSEAFTRPRVMYRLAKLGFTQSYTYFAWRNSKRELEEYAREVSRPPVSDYFRPSFWPNTPDILTEALQTGGRPAFMARLVLAATLSSNYGIYGPAFELMESEPREPGGEEYLDSEKYQIRDWDLDRDDSLRGFIARMNAIRRANRALHFTDNLVFHRIENDRLLAFSKRSPDGDNAVLVVVNLDPHHRQTGWVDLDLDALGVAAEENYQVHDLLGGTRYLWYGGRNYVELDPHVLPAHVFRVERRVRTERDFDYFL
ncbi:MAG: alpha-1,4-glucan--maltose-1-phosphate maltosyltransferase, partial [Gemmatimonadetes bacterium]|nr:alpha-1,4-glucan--maltose-1-phosphate maltosyltransferase [Gemmatimonadota bacterium]